MRSWIWKRICVLILRPSKLHQFCPTGANMQIYIYTHLGKNLGLLYFNYRKHTEDILFCYFKVL